MKTEDVDAWHQTVWTKIQQEYEAKDIYNCDDSGLSYRILPNRTLAFKSQQCAETRCPRRGYLSCFVQTRMGLTRCLSSELGNPKSQGPLEGT